MFDFLVEPKNQSSDWLFFAGKYWVCTELFRVYRLFLFLLKAMPMAVKRTADGNDCAFL